MKKVFIVLIMSVIMIGMAACGEKHSKAFNEAKAVLDNITENVNKAATCDEIDALTEQRHLNIEGIEAISQEEKDALAKLTEAVDKALDAKKNELDCNHCEAFNQAKQVIDEMTESIKNATTCEELDDAIWVGVFSIIVIEGIDEMPEKDDEALNTLFENLDEIYAQKRADLDCPEEEYDESEE